jgi:hypothetical protein
MHSTAMLSFTTTLAGPIQVELFDIGGRRIRELMRESFAPAGYYELPIHRYEGSRRLSAGTYFYRIRAEEGVATGRFVILN